MERIERLRVYFEANTQLGHVILQAHIADGSKLEQFHRLRRVLVRELMKIVEDIEKILDRRAKAINAPANDDER